MEKQSILTQTKVITLLALLCCVLWGSAVPCIKFGYQLMDITNADAATQVLFAGIRFTIAGILVLFFAFIREGRAILPDGTMLKLAALLSLAQTTGQYFFFYIGVAHASGVTSGILTGVFHVFAILMSCLLFRTEKMDRRKMFGCLLGFFGILAINLIGSEGGGSFTLLGEGFVLIGGINYALSSCMIGIFSKRVSSVLLSGWQFLIGGLTLTVIGLLMGGHIEHFSLQAGLMLIYLALVSAVAYTVWSMLLAHNPVSRVTIYGFFNPICSVCLSAVILREFAQAFRVSNLIALILVSAGIYMVNYKPLDRK